MKAILVLLVMVLGLLFVPMAEAQDCKIRPDRFDFQWMEESLFASGTWVREGSTPYDTWNFLAKTPNNFSEVKCHKFSKDCLISTAYVIDGLLTLKNYSFEVKSFTNETIIATFEPNPNTVLVIRKSDKSVTVDSIGVLTGEHRTESLKKGTNR